MEQLVIEVMSNIRFPMMSPRQLAELLLNPLTTKYKEFFVEKMAIGMSFHSGTYKIFRFNICLKTCKFFFLHDGKTSSFRNFSGSRRIRKKLFILFQGQIKRIKEVLEEEDGHLSFTPRLYTADTHSTLLTVENYSLLPAYFASTFVFSSYASLADCAGDKTCEWVVDVYPKGIIFKMYKTKLH